MPSAVDDALVSAAARHRSARRFPAMTWLHPANGAPLCRAAQPTQGLSSKTLAEDQFLLHALHKSVAPPAGPDESPASSAGACGNGGGGAYGGAGDAASAAEKARRNPKRGPRRLVIVDCRAKMNAQAHQLKAGGVESVEQLNRLLDPCVSRQKHARAARAPRRRAFGGRGRQRTRARMIQR